MDLLSSNFVILSFLLCLFCKQSLPEQNIHLENINYQSVINNDEDETKFRVAIIGGGVGGASAAYFFNKLIKQTDYQVTVDLFEKTDKIGGRLAIKKIGDKYYETGGTIIHERNQYAKDLVNDLGLSRREFGDNGDHLCIYNGKKFNFCESDWSWITYLKIWYKYGFGPLRLKSEVSKIIDQFERIYQLQKANVYFESVEDMLEVMSPQIVNLTKTTFRNYLIESGYAKRFITELLQAVTLVNYGQDINIPAFVGAVAFAGAGSELWSIKDGNVQLPLALAKKSEANVYMNTIIKSVLFKGKNLFEIIGTRSDGSSFSKTYNSVIVATPIVHNSLEFINFTSGVSDRLQLRNYHTTISTLVQGEPIKAFKGKEILTDNLKVFFTSLSKVRPVDGSKSESPVYKVFSQKVLTSEQIDQLFDKINKIDTTNWYAYPHYNSVTLPLPRFVLHHGIYHVNAIEWAASAIEMSLIGGKNAALLAFQQLGGKASNVYDRSYHYPSDEL